MRKPLAILLLLLYIVSSSGVAIKAHYCSGKLKSIHLFLDPSSAGKTCANGKKVSKDCCKDKVATNATTGDQQGSSAIIYDNTFKDVLNCVSVLSHGFFQAYDDSDTAAVYLPPPTAERHIHIAICVIRV